MSGQSRRWPRSSGSGTLIASPDTADTVPRQSRIRASVRWRPSDDENRNAVTESPARQLPHQSVPVKRKKPNWKVLANATQRVENDDDHHHGQPVDTWCAPVNGGKITLQPRPAAGTTRVQYGSSPPPTARRVLSTAPAQRPHPAVGSCYSGGRKRQRRVHAAAPKRTVVVGYGIE